MSQLVIFGCSEMWLEMLKQEKRDAILCWNTFSFHVSWTILACCNWSIDLFLSQIFDVCRQWCDLGEQSSIYMIWNQFYAIFLWDWWKSGHHCSEIFFNTFSIFQHWFQCCICYLPILRHATQVSNGKWELISDCNN